MLSSLRNMVRVADLRNKVLFTLLMIAVYQLGANVPGAGRELQRDPEDHEQLLGNRHPRLPRPVLRRCARPRRPARARDHAVHHVLDHRAAARDGDPQVRRVARPGGGRAAQADPDDPLPHRRSRPHAVARALSSSCTPGSSSPGPVRTSTSSPTSPCRACCSSSSAFTAGTAFVMWLGELITQRGIGQGMSILIFANVVATLPLDVDDHPGRQGRRPAWSSSGCVCVGLLVAIVFVELGQRRIPVTFARRVQGRRMYGGQSTYIPLKVNQAGVIPIIFASSLLYIPVLISTVLPWKGVAQLGAGQPATARPAASTSCSTACSSSCSRSSTSRSASTPTSRPTRSASRAATSPASAPDRPPSSTSRGS